MENIFENNFKKSTEKINRKNHAKIPEKDGKFTSKTGENFENREKTGRTIKICVN